MTASVAVAAGAWNGDSLSIRTGQRLEGEEKVLYLYCAGGDTGVHVYTFVKTQNGCIVFKLHLEKLNGRKKI